MNEIKNVREMPQQKKSMNLMEIFGFVAIGLTICGQIAVNVSPLLGQGLWLVSNVLFLTKAIKQDMGRAEITRNVTMLALTVGLVALLWFGCL